MQIVPTILPGSYPSKVTQPDGYNPSPLPPPSDYYVSKKEILDKFLKRNPSVPEDTIPTFDSDGQLKSSSKTIEGLINEITAKVTDGATEAYDTLKEIETYINEDKSGTAAIIKDLGTKADKTALDSYVKTTDVLDVIKGKEIKPSYISITHDQMDRSPIDFTLKGARASKKFSIEYGLSDIAINLAHSETDGYSSGSASIGVKGLSQQYHTMSTGESHSINFNLEHGTASYSGAQGDVKTPLYNMFCGLPPSIENVTHEHLLNLRDQGSLISGRRYRITDYVATTTREGTESANLPFDIIVTATSCNTLSEEASAEQHEGSVNFPAEINQWKVWYCLDNDTARFDWANEDGKGVVYRLIDHCGNDFGFDFRGITFDGKFTINQWHSQYDNPDDYKNQGYNQTNIVVRSYGPVWNNFTLQTSGITMEDGCHGNDFRGMNGDISLGKECVGNHFSRGCNGTHMGDRCYGNTFQVERSNSSVNCVLGDACIENVFSGISGHIVLGHTCSNNTLNCGDGGNMKLDDGCCDNMIDNESSVTLGKDCVGHYIESDRNIVCEDYCSDNHIYGGDSSSSVHLATSCSANMISGTGNITVGAHCTLCDVQGSIDIGRDCQAVVCGAAGNVIVEPGCKGIVFGKKEGDDVLERYPVRNVIISPGVQLISFTGVSSGQILQNFRVESGVYNKVIEVTATNKLCRDYFTTVTTKGAYTLSV